MSWPYTGSRLEGLIRFFIVIIIIIIIIIVINLFQVDLCVEAHNLEKFSANFKNTDSVKFPCPIWSLTRSNILVETYEEGRLMQNYVMDKSASSINLKLAEIGINTILKMVRKCMISTHHHLNQLKS